MQISRLTQIATHRFVSGDGLPFIFAWQAFPGPARVGVGLVETHVAHRFVFVERAHAGEREQPPVAVGIFPVKRCLPGFFAHAAPAIREPEFRTLITAGLDELEVLAVRDQPRSQRIRCQQHAMARAFVIETKAGAVMPDFLHAARLFDPFERRVASGGRDRQVGAVGRPERIDREVVLDIRQQQFLMLLFMMAAEHHARRDFGPARFLHRGEQGGHRLVHLRAIAKNFRGRGTGKQAALRAREWRSDLLIIRVEQVFELRVKRAVTGKKSLEQEGFEEPGRVRKVPLGGADIGHGLQAVIVRRERLAQRLALTPHGAVVCRQGLARRGKAARGVLRLPGSVADEAHHCASL